MIGQTGWYQSGRRGGYGDTYHLLSVGKEIQDASHFILCQGKFQAKLIFDLSRILHAGL